MDQLQFQRKKQWAGTLIPSMKRRRVGHDYCDRCIYMITLVVRGRRPLLGHVTGNGENEPVTMRPSELGRAILHELDAISKHYPAVKVIARQLMPDHLHFILFVQERLSCHLSRVISGFKGGCNQVYRQAILQLAGSQIPSSLWEEGFNDRILEGKDHLQRMMDYIDDNPRRLVIKRLHTDYFTVQRHVQAGGFTFSALGNLFLLEAPLLIPVQCTRRLTPEQIKDTVNHYLNLARDGAILISPSISPGEKAVMRAAFANGYPIILLQENGFAELAKPGGRRFDACAQGRLLLLAPWEHHNDRRTINRQQCHALNDIARALSSTPPPRRQSPSMP